jgi:class 3 adenylate cyclase
LELLRDVGFGSKPESEASFADVGFAANSISALAGPGEVLVSRTVKDLVAGSGLRFGERGRHSLKAVQEPMDPNAASN